jgi:hypothetical protein
MFSTEMGLAKISSYCPVCIFTKDGDRVQSLDEVLDVGGLDLREGGLPGVDL